MRISNERLQELLADRTEAGFSRIEEEAEDLARELLEQRATVAALQEQVSDDRVAFEHANEVIGKLEEDLKVLTTGIRGSDINEPLYWTSPRTVGEMRRQLATLPDDMAVGCIMSIEYQGKRESKAFGVSMSYEKFLPDGRLHFQDPTLPVSLAFWTYENKGLVAELATAKEQGEAKDREIAELKADYDKVSSQADLFSEIIQRMGKEGK